MAQHKITLLPGDGIGPEVTASVVAIIECAGVDVEWENYFVGAEAVARFGLPTVIVQEGGYLSDILGANLTATLAGFEAAR